jgi:geranylgeranyl diphosphate synthase, type I
MIYFKKLLEQKKNIINKELISFFNKKEKEFQNYPDIAQIIFSKLKEFTLRDGKRLRPILVMYGFFAFYNQNLVDNNNSINNNSTINLNNNNKNNLTINLSNKNFNKTINNKIDYNKEIIKVAIAVELMQSYLLIHDDIIDNDDLRRNKPTMHKELENEFKHLTKNNKEELGKSLAIIAGDIISVFGSEIIENTKFDEILKLKGIKLFNETIIKTCIGQSLDIISTYNDKITEKEIENIQQFKTAVYTLNSPLKLGAIFANANNNQLKQLENFALPLGEAFQIQDDILGLIGDKKKIGKNIGSDIKEGKKTLLVLKAINNSNQNQKEFLINCLGKKDITTNEINKFIEIVKQTKSLDYSINKAKKLIQKSKNELQKIKMNKDAKLFFESIADYMLDRKY